MTVLIHPAISALAFFQSTQLNLFEQFLTQAVSGIDSTGITSGMQHVAYVVLLVGFLWQVYQSALHGGDVRGLGASLIKYVITAVVVMNYHAIFTTLNQGFVNAGNWINSASGGVNLLENWGNDLKTQWSQVGYQKLWGLITGSLAGLLDAALILVAFILYPVVIAIFGFFYLLYGSILYLFGPVIIALMPLGAANRLAKSYAENVFIWNAWPVLYGGFGALLSAVQMGQVGQMLSQNNFLGGLGSLEGSFLLGFASIIYSLAIAVIPFIARKIVSGEVGSTAAVLVGAAATAITAGAAAFEGASVGAAAATAGGSTGASGGAASGSTASGSAGIVASGNQPAPGQKSPDSSLTRAASNFATDRAPEGTGGISPRIGGIGGSQDGDSSIPAVPGHSAGEGGSFEPTAGLHATEMRRSFGAVEERDGAGTVTPSTNQNSESQQDSSGSGNSSGAAMAGNIRSSSRRPSRPPSARGAGLATWGAYHAARLASYGAVSTGSRVSATVATVAGHAKDPVSTAGKLGTHAGKAAGSLAASSMSASKAAQTAVRAASHPIETVRGASGALANTASSAVDRVSATARDAVNEAGANFSTAYNEARRKKEQ